MARLTIVCSSTKSIVHQEACSNANGHNKVFIPTGRCTPGTGMAAVAGGQCKAISDGKAHHCVQQHRVHSTTISM
eukprot:52871-Pelagomonas_calceolata.AAC.1